MFRLLNVFSERFYQAFLSSGNQLSRSKLDQGGSTFWTDVAVEFDGMDIEFDLLISDDGVSLVWIHRSPWHTQLQNSSKCGLKFQATLLVQRPPPRRLATTVMTSGISVLDERTWSEHRGSGREFALLTSTQTTRMTPKRRHAVALFVAHEADNAHDETWKGQALLLQQQRLPQRLTILASMLECTQEDGTRLIQIIRDRDDESDEDFDDVNYDAELEEIIKSTTY
ncbi:hypothetical protein F442_21542 [Phytophthora nicotianae P10297]|uniref:Uncharacterized protein n=2 Tax=Phytophthora nicotianae TaxID=4792 RepID=W2Y2E0_PHYNI|nr:hypothetical protein L917_20822 [Phytophthora nicotianae]ETP29270.1 hypothetical protein F442_21542 [Phytophthora nicotianae P10297]